MYRVKGADGNIYGPIAAEVVRQWIREKRLNGDSQICRDGEEVWQSLRGLAEFAGDLTVSTVVPSAGGVGAGGGGAGGAKLATGGFRGGREEALLQVKPVGICFAIFGGLMLVLGLVSLFTSIFKAGPTPIPAEVPDFIRQMLEFQNSIPQWVQILMAVLNEVVFGLILLAGLRLMQLRSRGLVIAAAILMSIPCWTGCCCFVGLGFGIWALVLINKPEIQSEFD